jgi:hypothetical protein
LCDFVGRGVGLTPLPGLVRVGCGAWVGSGSEVVLVASVLPTVVSTAVSTAVPTGDSEGVVPGTASTTGGAVVVSTGVGAVPTDVGTADGEVVVALGRGRTCGSPPTAHAMPADPITATVASTTTGP